MNNKLYNKIAKKINHRFIVLSDILKAIHLAWGNAACGSTGKIMANMDKDGSYTEMEWDLTKPFLSDQSDELGEKLYTLLNK